MCYLAGQEARHALGPAMASHLLLAHLRLELLLSDLVDEGVFVSGPRTALLGLFCTAHSSVYLWVPFQVASSDPISPNYAWFTLSLHAHTHKFQVGIN